MGTSNDRWAGRVLRIRHEDGIETIYGHLDGILVAERMSVRRGDLVARSGSTGISSGPHLHFEVRDHDIPVNPLDYLPEE